MAKILTVDNQAEDSLTLRRLIASSGHRVIEAADREQALAQIGEDHPDLVLLADISQPDSLDIISALRSHLATATLPVIRLVAAYPVQADAASEANSGVDYVTRPLNATELLARIQAALRTSQVQAELQRRNEQLLALVNVMDAANSTLDLHELTQRVLERALLVTSMISGSIWLREGDQAVCLARYPLDGQSSAEPERRLLQPDTPLGRVLTTGKPEFTPPPDEASNDVQRDAHARPDTVLPLAARNELIGAFVFGTATSAPVPPEERAVLSAIAAHVAIAIQHAQLYQQAERQSQQLKAIDQQKDEFISITSHELKNPMASIKGYADLMLRRSARTPNDPNRRALEIISQQVNRMTGLLDQLLDVSRIGTNRLQLARRPADLVAIVWRAVEEMRGTTEQHQLKLEVQDEPLIGDFDEARIGQMITNLLGNAIKYSPEGGPISVRLERNTRDGDQEALISITDHGIGIPVEDRAHLFERFFRASNVSASFTGMGLGLFIARGLVVRHHGRIWVESEERLGTTFYVVLPLNDSDA